MCNTEIQTIGSCVTVMRGMLVMCNTEVQTIGSCVTVMRGML